MPSRPITLLLIGLLWVVTMPAAAAAPDAEVDPALVELAQRYAPLVVVREDYTECAPGQGFQPTQVEDVLGRDDVTLDGADGSALPAPVAEDLATAGADTNLNLPGRPLDPGCDYVTWSQEVSGGTPATLYAHAATDPAHPGQLALQYWFYWLYNDWNNRHEGDWEMVQLVFAASTAEEALQGSPASVAFAQHEGSETAAWDDPKLQKEGDRPVVYPSRGSHAGYFGQSLWVGKSAEAGFGCDDTSVDPTVSAELLRPDIVVVPSQPAPEQPSLGWLGFEGRWGEEAPLFNNGPTGPNAKEQWTAPITWQEELGRSSAVSIPPVPGPAVSAFCAATTQGSLLFLRLLDAPLLTLALVAALIAGVVLLVRATTWRGAQPAVSDQERTSGQIVAAAVGTYFLRWRAFVPLSVLLALVAWAAARLSDALLSAAGTGELTDLRGTTDPARWVLSAVVDVLLRGPLILVVLAAAMAVVAGPGRGPGAALRSAVAPPWAAVLLALVYLTVAVLSATLVLLPLALWLAARWAAAPSAAMVEQLRPVPALRRGSELTNRKRLRTLGLTIGMLVVVLLPAPLTGALLLLLTSWSFALINAVVLAIFAVALPIVGIALTLQFYDLRAEQRRDTGEPVPAPA